MNPTADEARFRDTFDRHQRAVMTYFVRRIPEAADACDATEEVFLVAWRRLNSMPEGDATLPWLYGVARKVLANHRRGRLRFARLRNKIAAQPTWPVRDPASQAVLSVQEEQMLAALQTLVEKDREVLLLTYWEQLSHEDIGRVLGCSTEAVHVRRYRAVKRLGRALVDVAQVPPALPAHVQLERNQHAD
jgi:RNA polymerase sigma factor (sigma-70 family)